METFDEKHLSQRKGSRGCKLALLALTVAIWACFSIKESKAQEGATVQCWEIYPIGNGAAPYSPILLNKCTGRSWFLTRAQIKAPTAKADGLYAFRWRPLMPDDASGEATFPEKFNPQFPPK